MRATLRLAAVGAVLAAGMTTAVAGERPRCSPLMLWGDGKHDDTKALNAWLQGESVVWAQTQQPVGREIAGGDFRLSGAIYVASGTDRSIVRFRMDWPATREVLTGGSIASGRDPNEPPRVAGLRKSGGDPGEGVPFAGPDPQPNPPPPSRCFIS